MEVGRIFQVRQISQDTGLTSSKLIDATVDVTARLSHCV